MQLIPILRSAYHKARRPIHTLNRLTGFDQEKRDWRDYPNRWERVHAVATKALAEAGVQGGRMLEIGGRLNPRHEDFPDFEYHALDLENAKGPDDADIHVAVGDITNCPQIPDASYDFVFSLDVFEHIDKPWLAAKEIERILKPDGVSVHSTLFSWRYHPCPIDYWRYTPDALKSLFENLDCVVAEFDYSERRRDLRGRDGNMVDVDSLGGWRENVRVHYAGIKR